MACKQLTISNILIAEVDHFDAEGARRMGLSSNFLPSDVECRSLEGGCRMVIGSLRRGALQRIGKRALGDDWDL